MTATAARLGGRPTTTPRHTSPGIGQRFAPEQDVALAAGRALLYPGLALTSILLLRGPAQLPVGDILIAAAVVCGLLSSCRPARRLPVMLKISATLLAAGGVLSAAVSTAPMVSISIAARLIYMAFIVPWALMTLLVERRHLVHAVLWWIAGAALCAFGAIVQMLLGDVIPGGSISLDNRFTGFTTHPSDLAGTTCMAAAAALLIALSPGIRKRIRYLALALALTCGLGLLLSGSVSGMIGLAAAVLFLLVRGSMQAKRSTGIILVVVAVIGLGTTLLGEIGALNPVERFLRTTGLETTVADYDTAGTRVELAIAATGSIMEAPIVGHGMVTADNVLIKSFTVHNNLLASWHAGGILVLLGVLIPTVLAVRGGWRRDRGDPIREAITASVIAAVAFAQTAPGVYNRYYWLPVAFALFLTIDGGVRSKGFGEPGPVFIPAQRAVPARSGGR